MTTNPKIDLGNDTMFVGTENAVGVYIKVIETERMELM